MRAAVVSREKGTPEPTVESDGNGVRIQLAWVNPTSDADRIRRPAGGQVTTSASPKIVQGVLAQIRQRTVGDLPAQPARTFDGHLMDERPGPASCHHSHANPLACVFAGYLLADPPETSC